MVTRRRVLRTGLISAAAVSGTAAALRPMLAAGGHGTVTGASVLPDPSRQDDEGGGAPLFDEVYRDRRIQGFASDAEIGLDLFIDGRPLRLMRRVDGSWISVANHFQPFLTPIATARGAVDAIGRAELSLDDAMADDSAMNSGHHH
ncbi:tyrosinase family oxidase copper chaperone [Streptomyces polygonati]|uniref:Tyrosinase family oxidase copper chaperone n=1 Tax=Streptomyces polygonati TaxID=1617087 RepID=A0ABV8HPR7_9ACTN